MRAVLMTKFPAHFIQDTIRPRLLARGIEVVEVIDPDRSTSLPAGNYQLVLYMHEMSSHAMWERAQASAKALGKTIWALSRKTASWPDELRDTSVPMSKRAPGTYLPSAGAIDPMLRTLASLRDAGQTYDAIAPQLRQFWRENPQLAPSSGAELRMLVEAIRADTMCPVWFRTWAPARSVTPTEPGAPDEDEEENDELLKLFEEDNARLTRELAALQAQIDTALNAAKTWREQHEKAVDQVGAFEEAAKQRDQMLVDLKADRDVWRERADRGESRANLAEQKLRELKPTIASNGLGAMIQHVRPLVPAFMTAEEALDRLVAYAKKGA